MRRATVLLALVLCGAAVAILFLVQSGDHGRAARGEGRSGLDVTDPGAGAARATEAGKRPGAGAAAPDDDPNRVPGTDLVLRGTVVRDGAPVAGAAITVTRAYPVTGYSYFRWQLQQYEQPAPPIAATESGDDGRFELRIARRTRLIISAFRAGAGSASLSLLMPLQGDPDEIRLVLGPGAVLRGEVVDAEGAAVPGAEIRLHTSDWTRPVRVVATVTGEEGRFEIADIADGSYSLLVGSPRHPVVRESVSVPAQSYVRVVLRDAGVIVGTVRDGSGEPVAGALVYLSTSGLEQPGGEGRARGETDANGAYRIEVFPGALSGAAVEHARCGRHVAGPEGFPLLTEVVNSGAEVRYDIRLRPGVPLRGRVVHVGTGAPAPGAAVTLLRLMQQWRGLSDVDSVRAGEDGRFEFAYVTEGTYALEAKAGHAARLVVRYAQQGEPFTIDLFVDGENPPPEQRLELLPAGAVRGVLLGAEARRGSPGNSNVFLASEAGQLNATPDDLGVFAFEHVPPMENAVAQSYGPQAKSDPFRVVAGETTEVVLDPAAQGGVAVIVEDERGSPVAGARLALLMESQLRQNLQAFLSGWSSDQTDETGRAAVSTAMYQNDWSRGQTFVILARRDRYEVAFSKSFKLPDAPGGETLRIVLRLGGTVRGRVEFAGGGPAANVWVNLSPKRDPSLAVDPRAPLTAHTGADGSFEVNGVAGGTYLATASHPEGKVTAREVKAGDEGVRLVIEPTLSISGFVVYEDGRPVATAQVMVMVPQARGEAPRQGLTGTNGRFRIGQLDAGSFAVEVVPTSQYGNAARGFEKKRIEGVAAGTENLEIVVVEGPGVTGLVEDALGRPVAGAGVIVLGPKAQQPGVNSWEQQRPTAITNGRGEFDLEGLDGDQVELLVLAPDHLPATKTAAVGGPPVTFRLERGGVIEGRILRSDGTALARHWLTVQTTDQAQSQRQMEWQQRSGQAWWYLGTGQTGSGQTDGEGRFRLTSLAPGEYRLFFSVGDEVLPATTLRTGAAPVTLRLQRALTIRGRIVDTEGRPVTVAEPNRVWLNGQVGSHWLPGTMADADGRFEMKGVPAGTVTLRVWAGQEYKPAQVEVTAGADDVVIVLERNQPQPTPPGGR